MYSKNFSIFAETSFLYMVAKELRTIKDSSFTSFLHPKIYNI